MTDFKNVLFKLKNRDAIVLYYFLFESLGFVAGKIAELLTVDRLAAELNRAGVATSRDRPFTAAVVRNRLADLIAAGIVDRDDVQDGTFRLVVFAPFPIASPPPPESPKPKPTPLFDYFQLDADDRFQNDNDNEIENKNESKTSRPERRKRPSIKSVSVDSVEPSSRRRGAQDNINNKYLNKLINKPQVFSEEEDKPPIDPSKDFERLRSIVDFERPDVATLRRSVASEVWERSIRPDLIDRIAAGIVLQIPGISLSELKIVAKSAEVERRNYQETFGRRGKKTSWETIALWVKSRFEAAGWAWTPTRPGYEPRPNRRSIVAPTRSVVEPVAVDTPLEPIPEGFTVDDLSLPFERFACKVRRTLGIDPFEARAKALEWRDRLRLPVPSR